ncbi:MAG: poly-gamma-glutamate biosynthesis protein PgsC [Nitrososphaerota archaeon]|nr:poly-gamma-glutamate biosynthesis protein PgsC [Nitrososphaerota archaeon]
MLFSDFYIAMIVGLLLSLVVMEVFGVSPGGLIVPGYLALVCDTPAIVVLVILVAVIDFVIVKYFLSKCVVLYGRRRFVALVILAILLSLVFDLTFSLVGFTTFEFRGIGIIVPALIANCFYKQGIKLTLGSTIVVTLLTFGVLCLNYYLL